jgi:glycosyltransferase involved in cell wall biosynthesis
MRFYHRAARLQTVSQSVADAIALEVPQLRQRIRVIPYPLLTGMGSEGPSAPPAAKERLILYVGRLHPEKGVHLLVEAFAGIPKAQLGDWRLMIVGPEQFAHGGGGAGYLAALKALAAPVADRVTWSGPVFDSERLAELYRMALVFVYPSLASKGETFGLAALEAMSHACAPVVSNLACFREYVVDRANGRVFDHTQDRPALSLSKVLGELLSDTEQIHELAAAAAARACDFALPKVAELYLQDFKALLNGQETSSRP